MNVQLSRIVVLGLLVLSASCAEKQTSKIAILKLADEFIIPSYRQLSESTEHLNVSTQSLCTNISEEAIALSKQDFEIAFLDWERIQLIRFGPIQNMMRDFRLQMWPDKRGTVSKQLRALMQSEDDSVFEPEAIANASVAIQGFNAYEYVLYNLSAQDSAKASSVKCKILKSISTNMQQVSANLLSEWVSEESSYRNYLMPPPEGNLHFDNANEISSVILNNMHTQLISIGTQKLSLPLGESAKKANPKRAEAWRSQLSLKSIQANVASLQKVYLIGFSLQLKDKQLDKKLQTVFEALLTEINALPDEVFSLVKDPHARESLSSLRSQVTNVRVLIGNQLANELGLSLGFNSLDGD